jgi:hypothetical protein
MKTVQGEVAIEDNAKQANEHYGKPVGAAV